MCNLPVGPGISANIFSSTIYEFNSFKGLEQIRVFSPKKTGD